MNSCTPSSFFKQKRLLCLWCGFSFGLLAIFYLVKFYGPSYTRVLYEQRHYDLLNRFSGGEGQQSLDFYSGRWKESVWGPLSQILSGSLFILLILCILHRAPAWGFWVAALFYMILTFGRMLWPIHRHHETERCTGGFHFHLSNN